MVVAGAGLREQQCEQDEDLNGTGLHGRTGAQKDADERPGQCHDSDGAGLIQVRKQRISGGSADDLHPGVAFAEAQAQRRFDFAYP